MSIVIPVVPDDPNFDVRVVLGARTYRLRFDWMERLQRWSFSVYDQDDAPLLLGVKLLSNWPILARYRYDKRLPPGEIVAVNLESGDPAGLGDLGVKVELRFWTYEELQGLEALIAS